MVNQHPIYLSPTGIGPYTALKRMNTAAGDRMSGLVNESDFSSAQSIIAAAIAGQPVVVAVPVSSFVGRLASGNIIGMTAAQARSILNVADDADVLSASQLDAANPNVYKQNASDNLEFRSLITGTPTLLTLTENANDITAAILPGGIDLTDLGDVSTGASVGEVLAWDGDSWEPAVNGSGSGIDNVVEDLTPQLGGNLDVNGKTIVSIGTEDIDLTPVAGQDVNITVSGAGRLRVNGNEALPVNTGTPARGDIITRDATEYLTLALGASTRRLTSDGTDVKWSTDTKYFDRTLTNDDVAVDTFGMGLSFQNATAVRFAYWVKGSSSPSVTFTVQRGADRGGAGTEVVASTVGTSTVGVVSNAGLTGTIASGDRLWLDISATSGVVDEFFIALIVNENP